MPNAAPHPCAHPTCRNVVPRGVRYCGKHKDWDQAPSAGSKGYGRAWGDFSRRFLNDHPTCERPTCERMATRTDHIIPKERGGPHMDPENSQALCRSCHVAKTIHERKGMIWDFQQRLGLGIEFALSEWAQRETENA